MIEKLVATNNMKQADLIKRFVLLLKNVVYKSNINIITVFYSTYVHL